RRRLRQRRRRAGQPPLRRRRLDLPERQAPPRGAAFRRGLVGARRRPRPHESPPRREHDLARGRAVLPGDGAARGDRRPARGRGAPRPGPPSRPPPGRSFFRPPPGPPRDPRAEFCEELLDALALGVGDYFEKNRFKQIGVALSGGRDSLLALLIAHRYVTRR